MSWVCQIKKVKRLIDGHLGGLLLYDYDHERFRILIFVL